jgi:hypothetical protein
LTALGVLGATTTYAYDWAQTGTTTTYLYPFKWYSVASSTGSGAKFATTTDYVFNGGSLVATVDQQTASGNATGTAKTRYVHPDHLGSTNVVTDENGNVVQTLDYYPYGSTRISVATSTNERIKGVTADRYSFEAVGRNVLTRFDNGYINNIGLQTAGKIFTANVVRNAPSTVAQTYLSVPGNTQSLIASLTSLVSTLQSIVQLLTKK